MNEVRVYRAMSLQQLLGSVYSLVLKVVFFKAALLTIHLHR